MNSVLRIIFPLALNFLLGVFGNGGSVGDRRETVKSGDYSALKFWLSQILCLLLSGSAQIGLNATPGRWQEMAEISEKLGRKKEDAIVALLSSRSVEDAAKACNAPA